MPRLKISNPERIAAKNIGFKNIPIEAGEMVKVQRILNIKFKTIATL